MKSLFVIWISELLVFNNVMGTIEENDFLQINNTKKYRVVQI